MSWADYCGWRTAFNEVIDDRYYSLKWLDEQVLSGKARLFCTENAAILVELKTYPTGAMDCHGIIAAGNLGDIVEWLIPEAEQWGREQGCVAALIESREGWSKVLKSSGYEPFQTTIRKEL